MCVRASERPPGSYPGGSLGKVEINLSNDEPGKLAQPEDGHTTQPWLKRNPGDRTCYFSQNDGRSVKSQPTPYAVFKEVRSSLKLALLFDLLSDEYGCVYD